MARRKRVRGRKVRKRLRRKIRRLRRRLWIRRAIKRPGRIRRYLRRKYGSRAFTRDGRIKVEYINRAIRSLGKTTRGSAKHGLKMALILAKRLKRMR